MCRVTFGLWGSVHLMYPVGVGRITSRVHFGAVSGSGCRCQSFLPQRQVRHAQLCNVHKKRSPSEKEHSSRSIEAQYTGSGGFQTLFIVLNFVLSNTARGWDFLWLESRNPFCSSGIWVCNLIQVWPLGRKKGVRGKGGQNNVSWSLLKKICSSKLLLNNVLNST